MKDQILELNLVFHLTCTTLIGTSVQLAWEEPKDDGNTEIIGYQVEKRDKRSGPESPWYIVHERVRSS